jgi:hypothetical protein
MGPQEAHNRENQTPVFSSWGTETGYLHLPSLHVFEQNFLRLFRVWATGLSHQAQGMVFGYFLLLSLSQAMEQYFLRCASVLVAR